MEATTVLVDALRAQLSPTLADQAADLARVRAVCMVEASAAL